MTFCLMINIGKKTFDMNKSNNKEAGKKNCN